MEEAIVFQQGIQRLKQFNVSIQIDSAISKKHVESNVICNKSPMFFLISLFHKGIAVDIVALLIPTHYFIFGTMLQPCFYAFLQKWWQRVAAKPAVMYNVRNTLGLTDTACIFHNTCSGSCNTQI